MTGWNLTTPENRQLASPIHCKHWGPSATGRNSPQSPLLSGTCRKIYISAWFDKRHAPCVISHLLDWRARSWARDKLDPVLFPPFNCLYLLPRRCIGYFILFSALTAFQWLLQTAQISQNWGLRLFDRCYRHFFSFKTLLYWPIRFF